ncbi:UNVERIFIED_CONTAM: hypothetical protein PYX00_005860 [Menopon gallinae]|uniref:Eye-specific diacylglycerol kinase n=1 Tax=Menopon gallinae TaxID=328185 RepID=A0AAW2HTQ5_9NEOP
MQRIRTTFKRSRTPTGAEMKTQSSLEVPKQAGESLLRVPANNQRSKSVDASAGEDPSAMYLEVPRRYVRRRSSGDKAPIFCVHCQYIDDIAKFHQSISVEDEAVDLNQSLESLSSLFGSSDSLSSLEDEAAEEEDGAEAEDEPENRVVHQFSITVTLFPNATQETEDVPPGEPSCQGRRRSITSPKLSRQSAFVLVDKNNSLENVSDVPSDKSDDLSQSGVTIRTEEDCTLTFGLKIDEPSEDVKELKLGGSDGDVQQSGFVKDIFLQVPELKRDRAASVDSCFTKVSQSGKAEEVVVDSLEPPGNVALRSRSVDIVLPTDEQARYKALAMAHSTRPVQG